MTVALDALAKAHNMPSAQPVKIGLDGDAVWQKFLASRIAKEREFAVYQLDGAIDVGFITGFDDAWVQLSTSRDGNGDPVTDPKAILIRQGAIAKIEETGKRVSDLPHESRERIRGFSYALRQHAERVTGHGSRNTSNERSSR